ncbi:guanine nucleotide-binding protein g(o) subunit alpha [Anaeramoeba ignava]|uniref:Guanine nucleotide-binding protein g(O) subunit alpha n=1 Tax=Anaeramoeba ignava TaxID=1746090 RepID=A0A9Q0LLZ7_ANAIG|nr:guanine nucleotide-binding protein g(o) subunit alpha [Anaeramoeba ignava]
MGNKHKQKKQKDQKQKNKNKNKNQNQNQINQKLQKSKEKQKENLQVFIFGIGFSGKSTLLRHLTHFENVPEVDEYFIKDFASTIQNNLENVLSNLVSSALEANLHFSPETLRIAEFLSENYFPFNSCLTKDEMKTLWNSPPIKQVLETYPSPYADFSPYYFGKIDEIFQDDYIPNFQDYLHIRLGTTGIFSIVRDLSCRVRIRFIDVGGARSERRKWENLPITKHTGIFFLVPLGDYHHTLFEDSAQNCLVESIDLFRNFFQNKFKHVPFVILFTKTDEFESKINKFPLSDYFPEYQGKTIEDATNFIVSKFLEIDSSRVLRYYTVNLFDIEQTRRIIWESLKYFFLEVHDENQDQDEKITDKFISPICEDFLNFYNRKELCDSELETKQQERVCYHSFILKMRLEEPFLSKISEISKLLAKEELESFLYFLYSGIIPFGPNGYKHVISVLVKLGLKEEWIDQKREREGLLKDLKKIFQNQEFDFFIISNGKSLGVHRVILAARSELFRGMFLSVQDDSNKVSDYSGKSSQTVEIMTNFFYLDNLENFENFGNEKIKRELIELFDYYQINQRYVFELEKQFKEN